MKGKLLATVTSKTNPGRKYEIRMGKDGVMYCTCHAWKFNKTCKHLTGFMSEVYLKAKVNKPTPVNDPESDILIAVKDAVSILNER